MTFDEIYNLVERSSHETAFNREECVALHDLLCTLNFNANVVEIGIEFGRSTTVIACVSQSKGFNFTAIDNWSGEYGAKAKAHVQGLLIDELHLPVFIVSDDSVEASKRYEQSIDLVHIDGDHSYAGVMRDMEAWLPKVKVGGYACFDDYGHFSLPEVYEAVKDYMKEHNNWQFVGQYSNKFGVFQRII